MIIEPLRCRENGGLCGRFYKCNLMQKGSMLASQQELNDIGTAIVTAAIRVHRITGPGLLESCYREALAYELSDEGLYVQQLVKVPFVYRGKP